MVPANLKAGGKGRLHDMWARRQTTKYNGCPYIVQKAAEAACSPEGRGETAAEVNIYRNNAALMRGTLNALGLTVYGGIHAPYLWVRTPRGMDSWDFFQFLLGSRGRGVYARLGLWPVRRRLCPSDGLLFSRRYARGHDASDRRAETGLIPARSRCLLLYFAI